MAVTSRPRKSELRSPFKLLSCESVEFTDALMALAESGSIAPDLSVDCTLVASDADPAETSLA